MENEKTIRIVGYTSGKEFRDTNRYVNTEEMFRQLGLTDEVENRTPPVAVNIAHLATMDAVQRLADEFMGRNLNVAILGISSASGPKDFERLVKSLGADFVSTVAVDISDGIFADIEASEMDNVSCLQKDARETGIETETQDIVLRDHIDNCAPPKVSEAIDQETARISKPNGIAIVNVTTREELLKSVDRSFIPFDQLVEAVGEEVIKALQEEIYDLVELRKKFPQLDNSLISQLQGRLLEIEPQGTIAVFGEDGIGHGEWFPKLERLVDTWQSDGFEIVGLKSRVGLDSHNPPLKCRRHNVILRHIK